MVRSAVPDVIDAIIELANNELTGNSLILPTLGIPQVNVTTYDGFGVSGDPGNFLMVGVDDPDRDDAAVSADSTVTWASVGDFDRDEDGEIVCAALAWNGNANQKAARDDVYAVLLALDELIKLDLTLGIGNLLWVTPTVRSELTQTQDEAGALALVVFRIRFRARI